MNLTKNFNQWASFIILINALVMIGVGLMEYNTARTQRPVILIFVLLGMLNLVMNNGAREGAKSQLNIVVIVSILSLLTTINPIQYARVRAEDHTLTHMAFIIIVNILTILYILISRRK